MAKIIEITDFMAEELDVYARFTENQLIHRCEPEKGMFIAESPIVISRALDAGYLPVSILMEKKHIQNQGKEILERCADIPAYVAEFDVLTNLTGFALTRGMLCAMYRPKMPSVEEIAQNAKRLAILESVVNPTNVGAIIRSAAALGVDGVILSPKCSDPLYRRAIRVSMGTVFQIPFTKLEQEEDWPKQTIDTLKHLGFQTAAMALCDDSVSITEETIRKQDKLAIILGTEGEGLEEETIARCDYTVKIPMSHGVDSLNVAAASAVTFWCLCSQ